MGGITVEGSAEVAMGCGCADDGTACPVGVARGAGDGGPGAALGVTAGGVCGLVGTWTAAAGGAATFGVGCPALGITTCSGTDCMTGGNGIWGAATAAAGSCGVPTNASCGAGPAIFT